MCDIGWSATMAWRSISCSATGSTVRVVGPARAPLTGEIRIEWVDGADPNDLGAEPNFGWTLKDYQSLPDTPKLVKLLREIANDLERDLANEQRRSHAYPARGREEPRPPGCCPS